jgi:hypothetical protein
MKKHSNKLIVLSLLSLLLEVVLLCAFGPQFLTLLFFLIILSSIGVLATNSEFPYWIYRTFRNR